MMKPIATEKMSEDRRRKVMENYLEDKKNSRVALDKLRSTKKFESMYETLEIIGSYGTNKIDMDLFPVTKKPKRKKK